MEDGAFQTTAGPCALGAGLAAGGGGGGGGFAARRWTGAGWLTTGRGALDDAVDAGAGADEAPELAGAARDGVRRVPPVDGLRLARVLAPLLSWRLAAVLFAAVLAAGSLGAVPKTPIEGTPSEPPTDSVCERPMSSAAAQPPMASVVAALAPNSCVRALRATRRCRRSARTRTSAGSHAGGGSYSGSAAVAGSGSASHLSKAASSADTVGAGVTPREPGRPRRRDGVTDGDREGAGRGAGAARGFGGADGGALEVDFADLDRGCPAVGCRVVVAFLGLHAQDDPSRGPDPGPAGFLVKLSDVHDRPPCPFARGAAVFTRVPRSGIAGSIEQRSGLATGFEQVGSSNGGIGARRCAGPGLPGHRFACACAALW